MLPTAKQAVKQRLNPFAFPAETDALFKLLIAAAVMIAVNQTFVLSFFYVVMFEDTAKTTATTASANAALLADLQIPFKDLFLSFLPVVVVFVAAFYNYRKHPQQLIEKGDLMPPAPKQSAAFLDEIKQLSRSVGVEDDAEILIKNDLRSKNAQAFGTRRQFFIKFDKGWLIERIRNPAAFRAVAFHELAHIFNRDVTLSYFAKSLWKVVYRVTIIPYLVVTAFFILWSFYIRLNVPSSTNFFVWLAVKAFFIAMLGLQITGVLLTFGLLRAHLLRVREFYADFRAALWGAEAALTESLAEQAAHEQPQKHDRWKRFWRNHPTAAERLKILREPHRLFRLTPDLPFVTGVLLSFLVGTGWIIVSVLQFIIWFFKYAVESLVNFAQTQKNDAALEAALWTVYLSYVFLFIFLVICGFLLNYLIVRTLILQLIRTSVQSVIRWRKKDFGALECLKIALLVSVGYEIGFLLTPLAVMAPWSLVSLAWAAIYFALTTVLIWLVLIYTRFFGVRLFCSHYDKAVPRWKLRFFLITINALLICPALLQIFSRVSLNVTNDPNNVLSIFLTILTISSFLIIFAAFAASFLLMGIWQTISLLRCPVCRVETSPEQFPGDYCGICGNLLAAWLFVKT